MITEVWAIIRSNKLIETKAALDSLGLGSMTIHNVLGRGKQKGFLFSDNSAEGLPPEYETAAPKLVETPSELVTEGAHITKPVTYIPKKAIVMIIPKEMVNEAVDTIISVNKTNHNGDGKIFVLPLDEAVRIRTGEHNLAAVS